MRALALALLLVAAGGCDFKGALEQCVAEGRCVETDAGAPDGGQSSAGLEGPPSRLEGQR